MAGVKIQKVDKNFYINGQGINALSDINITIEDRSFVALVGKSGSGKTTLLKLICGLEKSTRGEISFFQPPEKSMNCQSNKVSIVFQEPRLMPWLTVEQNMAFPLIKEKNRDLVSQTVNHYLDLLVLKEFKNAYPSQISGGMAQRTALGRTLCYDPDVILMDEPLGALDAFTRKKLQVDLINIFQLKKKTIVFVTHDVDEAVFLGQKVVIFEAGKIIEHVPVNIDYPRDPLSRDFLQVKKKILSLIEAENFH